MATRDDGGRTDSVAQAAAELVALLSRIERPIVAFSGGVDSSVVALAAKQARPDHALAVTGIGPALAQAERRAARRLARQIGIAHQELTTAELENPGYVANAGDRCYHCKSELYGAILRELVRRHAGGEAAVILSGANADDWGDHRPGLAAASQAGVRHPLTELGLGKAAVREVARYWNLPVWDKPASPCLASRLAYGVEVTAERLARVEAAEAYLRARGLRELRVRYLAGDEARIEVPLEELGRLCQPEWRNDLVATFKRIGFRYVCLDLEGFRSGNLNQLIGVDELSRWRQSAPADIR